MVHPDNTLSEDCLVKSCWWFNVDNILFTTLTCSPNRYPRHAYWGSDGKQTGKPGQGQGGVVASVRGNESRNSPGLPSSALSSRTSRSRPLETSQPSGARAKNERSESVQGS